MLHFRAVILMSLNKDLYSYHHKKFEAISFFKFVKKDKTNSLSYMYIYQQNKGHYINIFKNITLHFRAVILMSFDKEEYSYYHKKFGGISFFKVCKKRQNEFINCLCLQMLLKSVKKPKQIH